MKKKIIIINSIIITIMLFVVAIFGVMITKDNNLDYANAEVKRLTKVYAENYKISNKIAVTDNDVRVTVIKDDGEVLFDNFNQDVASMEKHLEREEIKSANAGENKTVIRESQTLKKELLYYAEKVEVDGGAVFVRVAIPVQTINAYAQKSIPLFAGLIFVVFAVQTLVIVLLNTWLLKPLSQVKNGLQTINDGSFTPIAMRDNDKDINDLFLQINEIGFKIANDLNNSKNEKQKIDYILNNLTNGVVALNKKGEIILINSTALKIFNVRDRAVENFSNLIEDKELLDNITNCLAKGESQVFEFESDNASYILSLKSTEKDYFVLVITDVSQTKKSEKMRSEFFANASHELKTPLTSLKGFNELSLINEKDDRIKEYLGQMEKDIQRVLVLIDDMLKLSKLENTSAENLLNIDLKECTDEVLDEIKPLIESKNIKVTVSGKGEIYANKNDTFTLEKNLIENAVQYTEQGGKVDVLIEEKDGKVTFTVKDNGIGIDKKHHQRIFERFYRVDKSRSRQTGGTGLGLSIVKHIAERYNGVIKLDSKIGEGTTVSVTFPTERSLSHA